MKLHINFIALSAVFYATTSTLYAAEDCPDLSYDMIAQGAPELLAVENLALKEKVVGKDDFKLLKKTTKLKKEITLGGEDFEKVEAAFITTREDKPTTVGDYIKSKGADFKLKGHKENGKCKYFLTTALEITLKKK